MKDAEFTHVCECDKVVIYPADADKWELDTQWISVDEEDAIRTEAMR